MMPAARLSPELAIVGTMLLVGGVSVAQAQRTSLSHPINKLRVVADLSTFDVAPAGPGGGTPFYVTGAICQDPTAGNPCHRIGDFHCWGWIPPSGVGLVSQEFHLFGRGKIQTQGLEDGGPRAVVGGTGEFRNVRGEATGVDLSGFPPEFIAVFELQGADK